MANRSRDDTLFDLRYAVRVLERQARLWSNAGNALKFASVLSGMSALAALTGDKTPLAIGLGVFFALLQALETALSPAQKSACAQATRRDYARLLAHDAAHDDAALDKAYQAIVGDDELHASQAIKELAFNDVVLEQARDPEAMYPRRPFLQALS